MSRLSEKHPNCLEPLIEEREESAIDQPHPALVAKLQSQVLELRDQLYQTTEQKKKCEAELSSVMEEKARYEKELQESRLTVEKLRFDAENTEETRAARNEEEIRAPETRPYEASQDEIREVTDELTQLKGQLEDYEEMKAELDILRMEQDQYLNAQIEVDVNKVTIQELRDQIATLKKQVPADIETSAANRSMIDELRAELQSEKGKCRGLEDELCEQTNLNSELSLELDVLRLEQTQLTETLRELEVCKATISLLEMEREPNPRSAGVDRHTKADEVETPGFDRDLACNNKDKEAGALKEENEALRLQLDDSKQKMESILQDLQSVPEQTPSTDGALNSLKLEHAEVMDRLEQYQLLCLKLESDLTQEKIIQKQRCGVLCNELEEVKAKCTDLEQELLSAKEAANNPQTPSRFAQLKRELDAYKQQLSEEKERKASLEAKLKLDNSFLSNNPLTYTVSLSHPLTHIVTYTLHI